MENNFKCITSEHKFFIPSYSFKITKSSSVYIDKSSKKEVECPECQSEFVETIKKKVDLSSIMYATFASASDEDKKKILRKRANKMKKKTEEQYRTIDREFRGVTNPKHY